MFNNIEKVIEEEYSNTTGIVIMKNNRVIYEKYFNGYTQKDTIHIASVTKSITSILIGIAIDKGYINNLDQKVLDFFPEYLIKRGEKTIQKITIRHLLTMTAPYKFKSEPYTKVYSSDNWTVATLDLLGGKQPIGEFKYTTIGLQILSGILRNVSGKTVQEFAAEYLFNPLGIQTPQSQNLNGKEEHIFFLKSKYACGWVVDPKGTHTAGWGLTLNSMDMAIIGQLYLNKGIWNGTELVSEKWIEDSTKESSRWNELSYGYLWWIIEDTNYSGYAAIGDGGNIIFVNRKYNLVVAMTASFKPRAKDRIEFIKKHILELSFFEDPSR